MSPAAPVLPVPTDSSILGAHIRDGGTLFGLWAPRATRVELALVAEDRTQHNIDMARAEDEVWTVHVPGIGAEQRYGFRVHGPWDPARGARFNPAKLLLDPYARAVTGRLRLHDSVFGHVRGGSDLVRDDRDSAPYVPHGIVVETAYDWSNDVRPRTPWAETVLYELHVR